MPDWGKLGQPKTPHSKDLGRGRFTTPQSNIRTTGLPNPCPVGLQSHCSILPSSPPLSLHQATALCQTHTWWDTHPSAMLATPRQNTHTLAVHPEPWQLGSLPPVCTRPLPGAGLTACWDTHPSPWAHCLQALLSPSHTWDDQNPPHPSGPAWLQLRVEQLEPHLLGQAPSWCETAVPTSQPGTLLPMWSRPQLYRLPR
jgi:hypothetical protein